MKGTMAVKSEDIKKLKKYKRQIMTLASKKPSYSIRKKICTQKGGFLASLIGIALPLIIEGIISAVKKK